MFNIRLATLDDMKNVFDLSNDDTVRKNSIHSEKIKWGDHVVWYTNKINTKNCLFYIIEDGDFVGYCRLDKEDTIWIITIHINKNRRNQGLGKTIINKICPENEDKKIIAFVKEKNIPSYRMFKSCNFKTIEKVVINKENYYKLQYMI